MANATMRDGNARYSKRLDYLKHSQDLSLDIRRHKVPIVPQPGSISSESWLIGRVEPEERLAALQVMMRIFPEEERPSRYQDVCQTVQEGRLDLTDFLEARRGGERLGVILVMAQPDGVNLVWPPVLARDLPDGEAIMQALIAAACDVLDQRMARLGQVLLDDQDDEMIGRMARAGFTQETPLHFLVRNTLNLPETVERESLHETYSPTNHARFLHTLASTYVSSTDCPWLAQLRTPEEALESHRLSGEHDPRDWLLFQAPDTQGVWKDVGLALLAHHPNDNAMELVYFGVVPEFRGAGWGRSILIKALQHTRSEGCTVLFLAVDAGNHFAHALYVDLGFVELSRRRALFRAPGGLAQQSSTRS